MKQQMKFSTSKKKPSDFLEDQLKKKELEFNFIKEVFQKESGISAVLTKNNLEDLNLIPKAKNVKKANNPKDFLEKIEKDNIRREEKEKFKLLEKLEAQVLGRKPKLNSLGLGITNLSLTISQKNNEFSHKRLIDNLISVKGEKGDNMELTNTNSNANSNRKAFKKSDNFDKKILDDIDFRKTIKKDKIEIDCDTSITNSLNNNNSVKALSKVTDLASEEKLDKEFMSLISQEKRKFFLFKTRELYDFLNSIMLIRYIEYFLEDGLEDLECILEIEPEYFKERKYTFDHQQRILIKIKELKNKSNKYNNKLEPDTENFDEDEQARLFRQAVEEFRSKPTNNDETGIDLGTNPDSLLPANKQLACCWNCLKIVLSENSVEHYFEEKIMNYKTFCTEVCLNKYKEKIYISCHNCAKRIEKGTGKFLNEKWFCEDTCLEKYMIENEEEIFKQDTSKEDFEDKEENELNDKEEEIDNTSLEGEFIENEYDPMLDF